MHNTAQKFKKKQKIKAFGVKTSWTNNFIHFVEKFEKNTKNQKTKIHNFFNFRLLQITFVFVNIAEFCAPTFAIIGFACHL